MKPHCDPEASQAEEVSHMQRPALLPLSMPYEMKLVLQAGSCCAARKQPSALRLELDALTV